MSLDSPRSWALLAALMIALSGLLAGCGSEDAKTSKRPDDPKEAIEQGLNGIGELKTGKLAGDVTVTLSGPLSNKAQARFNGSFDMSDLTVPAYSIGGTFQWGKNPMAPFGLAAKDATRYVSTGDDDFSHKGEPTDGEAHPLGEVTDQVSAMLLDHAIVPGEEGKADGLQLYTANIDTQKFQKSAIEMFNSLLQPGAGSTALGGGQVQGLLESAIQEAEATFGIDDQGVMQTIDIETDGGYRILGATQRIRIGAAIKLDGQDEPVQIEVPSDAKELNSAQELDQKLADFFAEQIPISF